MAFWRKSEDRSKPAEDPQALVARKEYDQAIKAYRSMLSGKPGQYVLNHKIADVLCLAGRQSESLDDYGRAADGYARDGYLIKAAAIVKKMQKIRPGDPAVERRLAELGQVGSSTSSVAPPVVEPGRGAEISFDMEMIDEAPASIPLASPEPDEVQSLPVSAPPPAGKISPAERVAANATAGMSKTPLFSDFTAAELSAVLGRLKHQSFPSHATIVKEGDPGDSLFVLSQGRVKVIGTGPGGKPIELAELGEGDFFGEVALLTGKPRTATIACLEETEVLELNRADLEELEGRHPRIRQVIQDFYEKRVEDTVESMLDAVRLPEPE